MIDGIVELPSSMRPGDMISNVRGGHLTTDSGWYVEISAGRSIQVQPNIHKYKLIRQDHVNFYEYIVLTLEPMNPMTLLGTNGQPVRLFPVMFKKIKRYKGDRPYEGYYYVDGIRELFDACPRLCASDTFTGRVVVSLLDYLTLISAKLFNKPPQSLFMPEYSFDIQPMSTGEVVNMIENLIINDSQTPYELMHELAEMLGMPPEPRLLLRHFAVPRSMFDTFSLWMSKTRMSSELVPHLSSKFGLHLWQSPSTPDDVRRNAIVYNECETDLSDIATASLAETIVVDGFACNSTDFQLTLTPGDIERIGSIRYNGYQSAPKKLYRSYDLLKNVLGMNESDQTPIQVNKTYLEEFWFRPSIANQPWWYIDLVWWLLTGGGLVNSHVLFFGATSTAESDAATRDYLTLRKSWCPI